MKIIKNYKNLRKVKKCKNRGHSIKKLKKIKNIAQQTSCENVEEYANLRYKSAHKFERKV